MRKFLSSWKYNLKPCRFFAKINCKYKAIHTTGWVICEGGVIVLEFFKIKTTGIDSTWIKWRLRFNFFGINISLGWKMQ